MLIVGKIYEKEVGNMKNIVALRFNRNGSINAIIPGYRYAHFELFDIPASTVTSS